MGFVEAIESCYKNYFNFSGRATRSEYWYFVLWLLIVMITMVIAVGIGAFYLKMHNFVPAAAALIFGLITVLLLLGSLVPGYSAQVRRLHDMGRSGWWVGAYFLLSSANEIDNLATHKALVASPDLGGLLFRLVFDLVVLGLGLVIFIFQVQPSREENNRFAGYR